MSIKIISSEIQRFLASDKPEVLCLTGKWGVGKSYAWDKYLKEAKSRDAIALKRYANVSLFGINSIEQLKLAIVEASKPTEGIGALDDGQSNDRWTFVRKKWPKAASMIPAVFGADGADLLIEQWLFTSTRNQLICLDDLERKGGELSIRDVFGLVSFLEEKRQCKIAIILNDDAFEGAESKIFKEYFEKTVDSHVQFTPSATECAEIALPSATPLHSRMRCHCIKLGISNIRVIRRLERLACMLQPLLSSYNASVFEEFLRNLIVLGWSKFGNDGPPLDLLKSRRSSLYSQSTDPSEEEQRWGGLLDAYGYMYFSPVAVIILEALDQGFFEADKLEPDAARLHEGYTMKKSEANFRNAWKKFHNSFAGNEIELVNDLNVSLRENIQFISPSNANSTIRLLRDLGQDELASELVKLYVQGRTAETFDSTDLFSTADVNDPEFLAAIQKKLTEVSDTRDPEDVLIDIAKKRGWSPKDVSLLSKVDVDGYYKIFKNMGDSDERDVAIRMALDFARLVGNDETHTAIADNARAALLRIAAESRLNELRVAKYGVRLDEIEKR